MRTWSKHARIISAGTAEFASQKKRSPTCGLLASISGDGNREGRLFAPARAPILVEHSSRKACVASASDWVFPCVQQHSILNINKNANTSQRLSSPAKPTSQPSTTKTPSRHCIKTETGESTIVIRSLRFKLRLYLHRPKAVQTYVNAILSTYNTRTTEKRETCSHVRTVEDKRFSF